MCGLRLWAHVGVPTRASKPVVQPRHQPRCDLSSAAASDDLDSSLDYSLAIRSLQSLAREIRCLTIEHFSDRVLDRLEQLYGPVPVRLTCARGSGAWI